MSIYTKVGLSPNKEIRNKRTSGSKTFIDRGRRRVIACGKPIHWWSKTGEGENPSRGEWDDIDCRLNLIGNNYDAGTNCMKLRIKGENTLTDLMRVMRDSNHYIFSTPDTIILDSDTLDFESGMMTINKIDDYHIEIGSTNVSNAVFWIKSHEVHMKWAVKTPRDIRDFEIIQEVNLTGFTITNAKQGNNYVPDSQNRFEFQSTEDSNDKFWIPSPRMWTDTESSSEISHELYKTGSKLYYRKYPTSAGQTWLSNLDSGVDKYLDNTIAWGTTTDGKIQFDDIDWDTCHDAGTGGFVHTTTTIDDVGFIDTLYSIYRSFWYFDTSSISSRAKIKNCTMKIYGSTLGAGDKVTAQKGLQSDILVVGDFDAFDYDADYQGKQLIDSEVTWVVGAYNPFIFNQTGLDAIIKEGTTKVCCREYDKDYLDVTPVGVIQIVGYYSDNAGTDYDPYLDITYVVPISISKVAGKRVGIITSGEKVSVLS